MSFNTDLSNISYTNKDFNSIYVELLEYSKKLSYRWDPSSSDESDPGVVLLKLAALIGDKNNYNIDKNVLELMPNSVTQLNCARQLFEQCGYVMHYYRAAEGIVNLTMTNHIDEIPEEYNDETFQYILPRFTMFSDVDNSTIFTSIQDVTLEYQTKGSNKTQTKEVPVLEGTVVKYAINNDSLITVANLDSNNRLYFTESDIAENGIFVTNVDSSKNDFSNYEDWIRVDTLETQEKGSHCYKFGVSLDGSLCYIQFPEDAEFLFGEGINITYIRTHGVDGNIVAKAVKQFYVDTSVRKLTNGIDLGYVSVSSGDESSPIKINNNQPITNGKNPETIEEAYKSYRRVKTTFDTLVSVKDYTDYMITSESASNGYVCDRTNDIQHSYVVKEVSGSGNITKNFIEKNEVVKIDKNNISYTVDEPSMTAFDLCIYALKYVPEVTNDYQYNSSFTLTDGSYYQNTLANSSIQSLQHNFINFDKYRILMVKNKYPITCKIIPRYQLTPTEMFQIQSNIETSLYRALNSKQMRMGELVTFETIENTILRSDDRIKHIESLSVSDYSTWVYFATTDPNNNSAQYQEMSIDSNSLSGGYVDQTKNLKSADVFDNFIKSRNELYYYNLLKKSVIKVTEKDSYDKEIRYYTFDQELHNLWNAFRSEIFAKNILSGVTPLYTRETLFDYGINQLNTKEYTNIDRVTTNTKLELSYDESSESWKTSTLSENENILLSSPNFVQENNFSSYVKIIYSLDSNKFTTNNTISANSTYVFNPDDFIVFFWKATDSDSDYTYIKYDASTSSLASAISPSFNLPKNQIEKSKSINPDIVEFYKNKPSGKGKTNSSKNELIFKDKNGNPMSETDFIRSLDASHNYEILTGNNIIKTLKINKIIINNDYNGTTNVSWILNEVTNSNTAPMYRLFDENTISYTLKSGEYLFYSNDSKTTLYLLGEGTFIERSEDWKSYDPIWEVPVMSYDDILTNGISHIEGHWKTIKLSPDDKSYTLTATEMQQVQIGPNNVVELKVTDITKVVESNNIVVDNDTNTIKAITLDNKQTSLLGFSISYVDKENNIIKVNDLESPNVSWNVTTILNLSTSPQKPQKLQKHQSITLYRGTKLIDTIENNVYMLSSSSLDLVGGTFIDLSPL